MRPAAQAVAGFYPTPKALLASIASLVKCGPGDHVFVDPCAGEGEAVFTLAGLMAPPEPRRTPNGEVWQCERVRVAACEMEATRFAHLKERVGHMHRVAHGDAFRLKLGESASVASVLFLNPPYDTDPRCGRLEEKWLRRFGPVLRAGGAMLFVVPFYALDASAETLGREFADLACFRFPGSFFDAFKQVVLVARRREPLLEADPAIVTQVRAWATDPSAIPELPAAGPAVLEVAGQTGARDSMPHDAWTIVELDERTLRELHVPWHATDRGYRLLPVPNVLPAEDFASLLAPRFPVATVPRPAHLAAGLASGVLSGARLRPTDPASGLPEILVRGTFNRRFVAVEEKFNRDGEKTGEVQAQVPELQIVALDLSTGTFHTLAPSVEQTGARRVADMTSGDLLAAYGRDLLAMLRERCPALYDPSRAEDVFELPSIDGARPLFAAQAHSARALAKVITSGPDRSAILLGEIGVGKSTVSIRTIQYVIEALMESGSLRAIVMTPPHVVPGFAKQVPSIWPAARAIVLESIADVDAFMADRGERPVVALLSREDAKLGHAWAGVESPHCPRCGVMVKTTPEHLAKGRVRCSSQRWEPTGPAGFAAARLALAIHRAAPGCVNAQAFVPGRIARRLRDKARAGSAAGAWASAREALCALVPLVLALVASDAAARKALAWLLWAIGDAALTAATARTLYVGSGFDPRSYGTGSELRDLARTLLLTAGHAGAEVVAEVRAWPLDHGSHGYGYTSAWTQHDGFAVKLAAGEKVYLGDFRIHGTKVEHRDENTAEIGSVQAAVHALAALVSVGEQRQSAPCGEPLFQAIPEPRRYPLAHYLAKRYRRQLRAGGFALVVDEAHEYAGTATAQAHASQQLLGLRIPTICMTGSVMNGYAESLFSLLWWTSSAFRAEFDRQDRGDFVRTYGYVKQFVSQRDREGEPVVFGAHTDRVETVAKETGQAPGVLPTLLLRHLLPRAVTLQMSDIERELPPAREIPVMVRADGDLLDRYRTLEKKLVEQMKRDRWDKDRAGKLFGQLAELPAALDRMTADVIGPEYAIVYPKSAGAAAGQVVVKVDALPTDAITPKEQAMLDILKAEIAEGRNIVVFPWHVDLIPRLTRLAGKLGRVAVLDCNKVAPSKRDAWIEREIARGTRAVFVNSVGVQTGINSMVPYFSTVIWYENPACNPQIRRQANGRIRRIGQREEARFYSLVYEATTQEVAHRLLLHKIGIGEAADGLDATAALQAAGVGTADALVARDLGRALFDALTQDEPPARLRAA